MLFRKLNLSVGLRAALVLFMVMSVFAMPRAWTPKALAGNDDTPLTVRSQGTCDDIVSRGGAGGLGVLAFGLGLDGTGAGDVDPNDRTEPINGVFNVTGIPAGASVVEAWLYWNGSDVGNSPEDDPALFDPTSNDGDPTITLTNLSTLASLTPTSTSRTGGPAFWDTSQFAFAHRADVSGVVTGNANYQLAGVDNFDVFINGAELVVVYSDPDSGYSAHYIGIAEGLDLTKGSTEPASGAGTKAVFFFFEPSKVARTADISVFLGGAGYYPSSQSDSGDNSLWYWTDTTANLPGGWADTSIIGDASATEIGGKPFDALAGNYWDSYDNTIPIPAGNSWLALQVDNKDTSPWVEEIDWVGATVSLPLACPDYTVTKTRTSPDKVQAGDDVVFDVVVTNTGDTDISTAKVVDDYDPAYLTYNASGTTPLPTSKNETTGLLTWNNVGPIAYQGSKTLTVAFTAAQSTENLPNDRTINTADVSNVVDANGTSAPDKSDNDSVEITHPALQITKEIITPADAATNGAQVGDTIIYRVTLTNTGDTTWVTVPVVDTYDPAYLDFVSTSGTTDGDNEDGDIEWPNFLSANLAPNASFSRDVTFTALATTLPTPGVTDNTAAFSNPVDENGDTTGPDESTVSIAISDPNLSIVKSIVTPASGPQLVGKPVVFDIEVTNTGNTTWNRIDLRDTFDPTYLDYDSADQTPDGSPDPELGTIVWTDVAGTPLAPSASLTVRVSFLARASTSALPNQQDENTGTVLASSQDENGDNVGDKSDVEPYQILAPATIGDRVWDDANSNGVQNPAETGGLDGVTVNLYLSSNLTTPIDTTTTAGGGAYSFTDLFPDEYVVEFTDLPTDYVFTAKNDPGGTPATDSDPNPTTGRTDPITLAEGETNNDIDAGAYELASIGDYVWEDLNGDGIQNDGSTGVANVLVQLKDLGVDGQPETGDETVVGSDTTDGNGAYAIGSIEPGEYYVLFTPPSGYKFTLADAGTGSNDSRPDKDGVTPKFTLAAGDANNDIDAGVYQPVTIGDCIFRDKNGNKVQDAGENCGAPDNAGVPDVTITLTNTTTGLITSTISAGDGTYLFDKLPPGVYEIGVPAERPLLVRTTVLPAPFFMASGESDYDQDFGYINPTAVDIALFDYRIDAKGLTLIWITSRETGGDSFLIYRAFAEHGRRKLITTTPIPATGDSQGATYEFTDVTANPGAAYYYWIEVSPQGSIIGPVIAPYDVVDPGDGGIRLFTPLVIR